MRGSAPGERRGGRQKGTPNKSTAQIKALAGKYGKEAIEGILELARNAENESTRLAAWNDLLDRGYGKPTQFIGGDETAPPIQMIERVIVDPANKNG